MTLKKYVDAMSSKLLPNLSELSGHSGHSGHSCTRATPTPTAVLNSDSSGPIWQVEKVLTNQDLVNTITKMLGALDFNSTDNEILEDQERSASASACETITAWCSANKDNRTFCVEAADDVWDDLLQDVFEGQPPVIIPNNNLRNFRSLCAHLRGFQSGHRTFNDGDYLEFRSLGAFVRASLHARADDDWFELTSDGMVRAITTLYTDPNPSDVPFQDMCNELTEVQRGVVVMDKADILAIDHQPSRKAYVLAALTRGNYDLESELKTSDVYKDDYDVFLAAVKWNGEDLEFASEAFKDDYDLVLAAVTVIDLYDSSSVWSGSSGGGLMYASQRLKGNPHVVQAAMDSVNSEDDRESKTSQWEEIWEHVPKDAEVFKDSAIVLNAIKSDGLLLRFMPEGVRGDPVFVKTATEEDPDSLCHATDALRNNSKILQSIVDDKFIANAEETTWHFIPDKLKKNKKFILAIVKKGGFLLEHVSEKLKMDFDVVLAAVEKNGRALYYAGEELKKDFDVVLAAVKNDGTALMYADRALKRDKTVAQAAVKEDGMALRYVDPELQKDTTVVLAAMHKNGMALRYATKVDPLHDLQVALAAVNQNGNALEYASVELKNNPEVVLAAVTQNGMALKFVLDEELRKDQGVVLAAVGQDGNAIKYASEWMNIPNNNTGAKIVALLKNASEMGGFVLLEALKTITNNKKPFRDYYGQLRYVELDFRNSWKFVLMAVKIIPRAMLFASEDLARNRDFVLRAVKVNGLALQYVLFHFKKDKEVVQAALEENATALQFASYDLKSTPYLRAMAQKQLLLRQDWSESQVYSWLEKL